MPASNILEIKGPQTIPAIEKELADLYDRRPHRLLLPVNLKESSIGGQASLVQLIATWGNSHADATLVTHIQADEDPKVQLTGLSKKPFGFSAMWMADSITDRAGKRDLKVIANSCSEVQFSAMWRGTKRKFSDGQRSLFGDGEGDPYATPGVAGSGAQVFLVCVDHDRWAIPQCYFADERLRGRDDFIALARASIKRATKAGQDSPVPPNLYSAFGAIFHELFKNTHEHARHAIDGATLRRSVRGIIVNRRSWTQDDVEKVVKESPPLRDYTGHKIVIGSDKRLRLLEISIFDSGIGLAAHRLGARWSESTTPEEELTACEQCLQRWASSTDKPHKGTGLFEVATTLSALKGFMRIRTGRLSLYRDFVANPVSANGTENVQLLDWTTQTTSPTKMAPVAGVLFTMFFPVISD